MYHRYMFNCLSQDCLPTSCKVSKEANVAIAKVKACKILTNYDNTLIWRSAWLLFLQRRFFQAASVFVLYATSSANSVAQKSNRYRFNLSYVKYDIWCWMQWIFPRKTITGSDVVNAMTDMEFDKFVRPLENSLASKDLMRKKKLVYKYLR